MLRISLECFVSATHKLKGYGCHTTKAVLASSLIVGAASAQVTPEQNLLIPPALDRALVPQVPGLLGGQDPIVKNRDVAVALGKALFWDRAIGSDGLACGSCHFHAGADVRFNNQVNPGTARGGTNFDATKSGSPRSGPNYTLKRSDFPFVEFVHPDDRRFGIKFPSPGEPPRDDVVSSSGAFASSFIRRSNRYGHLDECNGSLLGPFKIGKIATRQVEPRNSPTVINAAFFFRTFWDGRANNIFNGRNPFGARDPNAKIWVASTPGAPAREEVVHLPNSSLASQASAPPANEVEMSCAGRTFPDIGRKVLSQTALTTQWVHPQDSVLAPFSSSNNGKPGLNYSYRTLIEEAFADRYWKGYGNFGAPALGAGQKPGRPYDQMEANFSFFFGLALQLYQSTLISDEAPFDKWRRGDATSMSPEALRGLALFVGKAQCINCHAGPEFSHAASHLFTVLSQGAAIERMVTLTRRPQLYDSGFYNIGVTPSEYDIGAGANDPFGNPLSFSAQWSRLLRLGILPPRPVHGKSCHLRCKSTPWLLTAEYLSV